MIRDILNDAHKRVLEEMERHVDELTRSGMVDLFYFTRHGKEHWESVEEICNLLLKEREKYFSSREILILIISIFLHDIGMFLPPTMEEREEAKSANLEIKDYLRNMHHKRIVQYLDKHQKEFMMLDLGLDDLYDIREICQGHRKEPLSNYTNITTKKLAALLRIADELDIGPKKTPLAFLEEHIESMDNENRWHWVKHRLVKNWGPDNIRYSTIKNVISEVEEVKFLPVCYMENKDLIDPFLDEIIDPIEEVLREEGVQQILRELLRVEVKVEKDTNLSHIQKHHDIGGITVNDVVEDHFAELLGKAMEKGVEVKILSLDVKLGSTLLIIQQNILRLNEINNKIMEFNIKLRFCISYLTETEKILLAKKRLATGRDEYTRRIELYTEIKQRDEKIKGEELTKKIDGVIEEEFSSRWQQIEEHEKRLKKSLEVWGKKEEVESVDSIEFLIETADEELKNRFFKLMVLYHPDLNPDLTEEEKEKNIFTLNKLIEYFKKRDLEKMLQYHLWNKYSSIDFDRVKKASHPENLKLLDIKGVKELLDDNQSLERLINDLEIELERQRENIYYEFIHKHLKDGIESLKQHLETQKAEVKKMKSELERFEGKYNKLITA